MPYIPKGAAFIRETETKNWPRFVLPITLEITLFYITIKIRNKNRILGLFYGTLIICFHNIFHTIWMRDILMK